MKNGNTFAKPAVLLAFILWGTITASAGTITSFTAAASPSTPSFVVTGLTLGFTGSLASVSGTITCAAASTCSGPALDFTLGVTGLTASTPVFAEIIGTATAPFTSFGSFAETSPVSANIPFTICTTTTTCANPFDKIIYSSSLPAVGSVTIAGSLDLTIPAGQSITLPLNLGIGAQTPAPEPSTLALLGLGLLGGAAKFRRRRSSFPRG